MRQVDGAAALHLLSLSSSPFCGVESLYDYGFRPDDPYSKSESSPTRWTSEKVRGAVNSNMTDSISSLLTLLNTSKLVENSNMTDCISSL